MRTEYKSSYLSHVVAVELGGAAGAREQPKVAPDLDPIPMAYYHVNYSCQYHDLAQVINTPHRVHLAPGTVNSSATEKVPTRPQRLTARG